MNIPRKVKIGAVIYDVRIKDDWLGRNGDDGEVKYESKFGHIILIGNELTQEAKEVTFIHEALHAMNSTISHEFLDSLSEQLYQFLKDNKLNFSE